MVTDQQVRRLFAMQNKYEYQYQMADVAGISSKTAHKYLKNGKLPSQCKIEHTWPTRKDPFVDDWAFVEQLLEDTKATLEAKTIFEYLQRAEPGKYHNGQLRILQRRVKAWKVLYGPAKEVFFSQIYYPGQWACSDFTSMNKLNITIAHQPFEHLLRLLHNTYSVHSRLVGETVKVHLYADKLQIWYAQRHIETLPRLRGENDHCINYRHIIDRLVRKPGSIMSS